MKKCEKCGKIYSDDMYFCSDCGIALKEAEPDTINNIGSQVKSTVKGAQSNADTYFTEQGNYRNGAEKLYKQHGGLVLGILGIIFGWWISGLVALILALYGFYLCKFEKSQTLRRIALACCTIALLFGILAFLL